MSNETGYLFTIRKIYMNNIVMRNDIRLDTFLFDYGKEKIRFYVYSASLVGGTELFIKNTEKATCDNSNFDVKIS